MKPPGDASVAATPSRGQWVSLLISMRPRQWGKNLLVFAAPATGGVLGEPDMALRAILTFVSFCFAASGTYLINDVADRADDRAHPRKRFRPIAAGELPVGTAIVAAAVLLIAALVLAVSVRPALAGVVAAYVALTLAYTFILRDFALIDVGSIAGGFLLRAVAGGVATDVTLSSWFLMVAGFGSLFVATGKRHAEYLDLGELGGNHRRTLTRYTESYLRYVQYSSSTVAITAYALWAFEGEAGGSIWSGLSVIPFVLGIFRYGMLLDAGRGATPEDLVLSDPPLLVLGALWGSLVVLGVYL
jgi:decaprenyl-phosphate phosphoribosyltransferase